MHLAAQAGVRYSIENPRAYIDANIVGTLNILEGCRHNGVEHLVFASSSSVYGANTAMPFSVHHNVDHPVSLYAATKKSNELMAHSYAHLYRLPVTGLRFFTVYGPWGRPDMSLFLFTRKILAGEPIDVFNYGKHERDFTYIDDIVQGVVRTLDHVAEPNPALVGRCPRQRHLDRALSALQYRQQQSRAADDLHRGDREGDRARKPRRTSCPCKPGDVPKTYADVDALADAVGFRPATPIEDGVQRFVAWYRGHYGV